MVVNKYFISLVIVVQFFSCQSTNDKIMYGAQEPLLECLLEIAIEADQAFDPSKHYLSVIQEHRVDMNYSTLSLQQDEFKLSNLTSNFYQSMFKGIVIQFYYYNNLGKNRGERREIDSLIISNQLEWTHVPSKKEDQHSTDLYGVIYDPVININLLYDSSSRCIVDSVMHTSLGLEASIKKMCNLCPL
jgi:hypothetical protein